MTDLQLFTELSSLPHELKKEVRNFIEFLKTKARKEKKIKQRQFGAAKGFFVMHKDFDKPLEDFKDYM
jgi:ABC-type phosphate/phosphonate transport system substrate-binding protein